MLKTLFVSSSSACFEWENELPYYAERQYTVYLNGEQVLTADTNVFSLFGLAPDTEYRLTTSINNEDTVTFKTKKDTCVINVLDFGANADGLNDDTLAIQTAINCLPRGAKLIFPSGQYLTSPICLKSHITIELAEGASILGHTDTARYPVIPGHLYDMVSGDLVEFGSWEGNSVPMHQSLIFAEYAEDITIIGPGTVDGNAQNSIWWQNPKAPIARPRLLFFNRCKNVRVHGIVAQNSASWQLHPYYSQNIDFLDISIFAPKNSPNTDAIDPEACDLVKIIGCKFSVGDDCIAIKSSKIDMASIYKTPANRHTIRNCLMQFGHGAVTLGSEMSGGVTNLTVNRCVFRKTDRGLRIKTRRGRGKYAIIDGVLFENIKMEGVITPIAINMWYNCCDPDRFSEYVWSRERLPVDDRTPYLGDFTFKNMVCTDCEAAACYCDGLPERPIKSITLDNIHFTFSNDAKPFVPIMQNFAEPVCKMGMYIDNVETLTVTNITIEGHEGDDLIAKNVGKIIK
ncbi:MAG: glycoside hydrolase family 28 protein [Clostridia bacterium]|nr:glycoside hydrolase family 28 protein [Clostridia bacterium]